MNLEKNEETLSLENMTFDCITRCPECNLISSLKFHYKEGKPNINYTCENGHNGDMLLEEYLKQYNNHSLLKEKCQDCNKNQNEVQGEFYYCITCNKFLCILCLIKHPNNEKHNAINCRRYDSFCKDHCNSFSFYCKECKKNICIYCKLKHKSHELEDLSEFNYKEESKGQLEEKIKNIEKKLEDLDLIKQNIISELEKLKKSSENEIKFFKILINSFKNQENQNNLNYNIIHNLKDFDSIFYMNKIQIFEKAYEEGNKYTSFLQNIYTNIKQITNKKEKSKQKEKKNLEEKECENLKDIWKEEKHKDQKDSGDRKVSKKVNWIQEKLENKIDSWNEKKCEEKISLDENKKDNWNEKECEKKISLDENKKDSWNEKECEEKISLDENKIDSWNEKKCEEKISWDENKKDNWNEQKCEEKISLDESKKDSWNEKKSEEKISWEENKKDSWNEKKCEEKISWNERKYEGKKVILEGKKNEEKSNYINNYKEKENKCKKESKNNYRKEDYPKKK